MRRLSTKARRESRRKFKVWLWQEQAGLCHWCGEAISLYFDPPPSGRPMPTDTATFDHLDDRFSTQRGKHPGKIRTVLACLPCNNRRGVVSQAAQPIEELHRRASRHGEAGRP